MIAASVIGPLGAGFICLYVLGLLVIGWLGHRAKREDSLSDFYLGGRGFGFAVLVLTLYATQYSGNTLFGFVGKTYRGGFAFLASMTFMMGIIGAYLIFAPRLQRRAHKRGYITMGDYLQDRFKSRALTSLGVVLGIIALLNYVLTNLKVLGGLVEFVSGGAVDYAWGIVLLALVMVIYENLGGMRSVAWTDAMQGVILLLGVGLLFVTLQWHFGGVAGVADQLAQHRPDFSEPPDWKGKSTWLGQLLLIFFGISMYPHAIQRIYAARDEKVLRRSLQVMVFLPLVTTFFMVTLGIMAAGLIPGLEKGESDRVTLDMLELIVDQLPAMKFLMVLFIAAIVAATMSTIDSSLLAISSLVTRDLYQPRKPEASQKQLTLVGKSVSIGLMVLTVTFAIALRHVEIWSLIKLKLELLCQVAPAFFLGLHWRGLRAGPTLAGMAVGTAVAVWIMFWGTGLVSSTGIQAGLWGLAVNFSIAIGGSLWRRSARSVESELT